MSSGHSSEKDNYRSIPKINVHPFKPSMNITPSFQFQKQPD